jgi:hypothetical protein
MVHAALTLLPIAMLSATPGLCAKRADIAVHLAHVYQERPVARGLSEKGVLLEVFASRDGASWTAVASFVDGMSCLIASGHFWEEAPDIDLNPERPS